MQGFPQFNQFPAEIRIEIWKRVPTPPRFLVLNHCHCTRTHTKLGATKLCKDQGHLKARSAFRWSVYPRRAAIPPALHCCHESREVLLSRYFQPPCGTGAVYNHVTRSGRGTSLAYDGKSFPVAFQCPFVDYESDIFTIRQTELMRISLRWDPQYMNEPLLGFDVSRIRHVGWLDNFVLFSDHPSKFTPLNDLASLHDLTVLDVGLASSPAAFERLAESDFLLQPWDGEARPPSQQPVRNSYLFGENIPVSAKRIQVVLWHARQGIEVNLWHQLHKRITDPEFEDTDELDCRCSLTRPHTVPAECEVVPLRWLRVVPVPGEDEGRGG